MQQLENLVERGGVAAVGVADRVEPAQVARDQVALEQRLACAHPVAVAARGVDLAVVRDEPERVRQRPARERVGREPAVHDRQRRLHALVAEVGEEVLQLLGREHALVDQGAARQRREVDVELVLGALAQAERHPVELEARAARSSSEATNISANDGIVPRDIDAEDVGVDRHLAPAENGEALFDRDRLDAQLGRRGGLVVERQERHAGRVRAQLGQLDATDGAQELVGDLHQDAGTVAGVGLAADSSAVIEVAQRCQTLGDDVVARRHRSAWRRTRHHRRRARCSGHTDLVPGALPKNA